MFKCKFSLLQSIIKDIAIDRDVDLGAKAFLNQMATLIISTCAVSRAGRTTIPPKERSMLELSLILMRVRIQLLFGLDWLSR